MCLYFVRFGPILIYDFRFQPHEACTETTPSQLPLTQGENTTAVLHIVAVSSRFALSPREKGELVGVVDFSF